MVYLTRFFCKDLLFSNIEHSYFPLVQITHTPEKMELESNTIPERLATKLNVEHDLIGPIEADRGDPYALQVIYKLMIHKL